MASEKNEFETDRNPQMLKMVSYYVTWLPRGSRVVFHEAWLDALCFF